MWHERFRFTQFCLILGFLPLLNGCNLVVNLEDTGPNLIWSTPVAGTNGINGLTLGGTCGSTTGDLANLKITGDISGLATASCTSGTWFVYSNI